MKMLNETLNEIAQQTKPYYVYVLYKPDGTPFYVGKGKNKRVSNHESEARCDLFTSHKVNTIRKIWSEGGVVSYGIDSWHNTGDEACDQEIALIAKIGRRCMGTGPLTNVTAGGGGLHDVPQELRDKIAVKLRKLYEDNPHLREEMSQLMIKRYEDRPELKEQISESVIEYCLSHPEFIENLQEKKNEWIENNPEAYAEAERKRLEICQTPEVRQAVSETLKEYYKEHPEVLELMSERASQYFEENPEAVERSRQVAIENCNHEYIMRWLETVSDEEWEAKMQKHSDFMKEWHASEEGKLKTKEAAEKRNVKFRTEEHRRHMAQKTAEYNSKNPEAHALRRAKAKATRQLQIDARQNLLLKIQERLLSEKKLRVKSEFVNPKQWYTWKKRGLILADELKEMEQYEL